MEPSVNVNANGSVLRSETNNAVVYYHLNKLLASQFDKRPQEVEEASRSATAAATAAAAAAKAARANANAKAYAAAKAVAAAKAALNLIASFPNQEVVRKDKHVVEAEVDVDEDGDMVLNDQELPYCDASNGMIMAMPISSPSCEHRKNEEWSTGRLRERTSTEHDANSNKRSAVEVGSSSRVVEESSVSGQGGAKEDVQKPTRKRGRPRKH